MALVEFDQIILPDGTVFDLNDGRIRFLMSLVGGAGMPPIEYHTQRGISQHGETVISYALRPRTVQMVFRQNSRDRDGYWQNRAALLDALRPNRGLGAMAALPVVLRKIRSDGSRRDLSVYPQATPAFSTDARGWDEFAVQDAIRLIAYDPLFFDPEPVIVGVSSVIADGLTFPMSFQFYFATQVMYGSQNVAYAGSFLSYPKITISGPLSSPTIQNTTTGEKIALSYSIGAAEQVIIDLTYGEKLVKNNLGTILNGVVTTDSDLGTFHIATADEAPGGINTIVISGSYGTGSSSVMLTYYNRYLGY